MRPDIHINLPVQKAVSCLKRHTRPRGFLWDRSLTFCFLLDFGSIPEGGAPGRAAQTMNPVIIVDRENGNNGSDWWMPVNY